MRRDWLVSLCLFNGHKEYFAESTEAYRGVRSLDPLVHGEPHELDRWMDQRLQKIRGPVQ